MLGLKYDIYSHTSDLFERMLEECEKMIKAGKAYADNTEPELMKQERETRTESKNRSSSKSPNLSHELHHESCMEKRLTFKGFNQDLKSGCPSNGKIF